MVMFLESFITDRQSYWDTFTAVVMLVYLESLKQLGASDLQTDSLAEFACPAGLWPLFFPCQK